LSFLVPVEPYVPLYFFDIRDGEDLYRDEEGLWFPDFESAEREATEAAAAILLDTRRSDRTPSQVSIEVRDENDRRLLAAKAAVQIDRGLSA